MPPRTLSSLGQRHARSLGTGFPFLTSLRPVYPPQTHAAACIRRGKLQREVQRVSLEDICARPEFYGGISHLRWAVHNDWVRPRQAGAAASRLASLLRPCRPPSPVALNPFFFSTPARCPRFSIARRCASSCRPATMKAQRLLLARCVRHSVGDRDDLPLGCRHTPRHHLDSAHRCFSSVQIIRPALHQPKTLALDSDGRVQAP